MKGKNNNTIGVFWAICNFNALSECDFTTAFLYALHNFENNSDNGFKNTYCTNVQNNNLLTHKSIWANNPYDNHSWNYYPRGRVQRKANGDILVFANHQLSQWDNCKNSIITCFNLCDTINNTANGATRKIRFIYENTSHYLCHADDNHIY